MAELQELYDLKAVKLPRLSGLPLRLYTEALESPLRPLFLGYVFSSAGIDDLRQRHFREAPMIFPLVPVVGPDADESRCIDASEWPEPPGGPPPGFGFPSTADFAEAYRDGRASPEDVASRLLDAVDESDRGDRPLRVFIAMDADDILRQARDSAARLRAGRPLSVLDGVPVAVKDEVDMVPFPTTAGTSFLGQKPAGEDSTTVSRLRAAGAILIGKANMHEIGIGVTGQNPHFGTARNPYNPAYHTGGSSSGPAAAVTAGFCPFALGADGGGSIRIPSSLCGLVGLKATFGRVSEYGAAPLGWSVAHIGPIASSVYDAALGYAVMAGPCGMDHHTWHQPSPHLEGWAGSDLSDLTLGIFEPWFEDAEPEIVAACTGMIRELESAGATIKKIAIPELQAGRVAHLITIAGEMAQEMDQYYRQHRRDFGLDVRLNLALARQFTVLDYVQAQRIRGRMMKLVGETFDEVDAIMTPTTGVSAPMINEKAQPHGESDLTTLSAIMRFVFLANLTGLPAISFPAGYTSAGMPIGLMAMGRWWEEHQLLRLARAAELRLERRKPPHFYNLLEL
jgi:Asp-tRNA(Asn)/Glu-tRNA(Gln) amidotransferase A subunit family amidase